MNGLKLFFGWPWRLPEELARAHKVITNLLASPDSFQLICSGSNNVNKMERFFSQVFGAITPKLLIPAPFF
jgi:hypothetical protein